AVEEEAVGAAALNHRRLPHRDAALADQVLAERFDPVVAPARLLLPLAVEGLHLLRREQLALHQEGAVLGDVGGGGCHGRGPGRRRKRSDRPAAAPAEVGDPAPPSPPSPALPTALPIRPARMPSPPPARSCGLRRRRRPAPAASRGYSRARPPTAAPASRP